jgi:outer membrane lipoprotein carrier protein
MGSLEKKMTSSRFWKHIIPIIFIITTCFSPAVHAQTVQEVVATVENHYSELKDLSAKVIQKNNLKSIGKTQTFEGSLLIKKPGKLRLDYTNGQVILVDGKAALFYSKKSEQMVKKTFTDVEHMNIPVAFLLGAAHIRDDFDVLQPDPKAPRTLELLPKKPGAAMKKLSIETDDAGRIMVLVIFDKSGNTTDIRFSEIAEDVGLTDKQFAFTTPKGTEIIEQ